MRQFPKRAALFAVALFFPWSLQAGAWSQKSGRLGLKVSYFSLVTDERFSTGGGFESRCLLEQTPDCFLHALDGGVKIPIFNDLKGKARSRAVFLSLTYGVIERVEVGAQIGYFSSENDFDVDVPSNVPITSEGFSDLRAYLKVQYLKIGSWAAAASGGFKAPTGRFQRNAFGVSLGEGGWDYQLTHEVGLSLWPLPVYANLMLGYRWRATNEANVDFGDEFLYNVEAGVDLRRNLLLKVSIFGFSASEDRQLFGAVQTTSPGRKINFFAPSLFWTLPQAVTLELGVEHALSGRNYVAGTKLNFAIQKDFQLY